MYTPLTALLCCPACGAPDLVSEPEPISGNNTSGQTFTGSLSCSCGCSYPVREGVPNLRVIGSAEPPTEFSAERLRKITDIEERHFWFVGRRAWLQSMLTRYMGSAKDVLDLGCGSGFNARELSRRGLRVVALDGRPEGLRSLVGDNASAHKSNLSQDVAAIQADATHLPFRDGSFDAVVMLDVMEHTDDIALVREVYRVLRDGGMLFLTVPAMPWLWSQRDVGAGHRRRYTRSGLKRLLSRDGWKVKQISWYQCLLFPLVLATRLAARRQRGPVEMEEKIFPVINGFLSRVNRIEAGMGTVIPWPWGSSLAAVCQKVDA